MFHLHILGQVGSELPSLEQVELGIKWKMDCVVWKKRIFRCTQNALICWLTQWCIVHSGQKRTYNFKKKKTPTPHCILRADYFVCSSTILCLSLPQEILEAYTAIAPKNICSYVRRGTDCKYVKKFLEKLSQDSVHMSEIVQSVHFCRALSFGKVVKRVLNVWSESALETIL